MQHFALRALHRLPIDPALRERLLLLRTFLDREDLLEYWTEEALRTQKLTAPSPYSEGNAVCRFSVLGRWNFLCFRDGAQYFYIVQHRNELYHAFYLPAQGLYISREGKLHGHMTQLTAFEAQCARHHITPENATRHDGPFQGLLNAHPRPYHVMYDRLPFLHALLPLHPRLPLLTVAEGVFLEATQVFGDAVEETRLHTAAGGPILGPDIKREIADAVNGHLALHRGFVLCPNPSSSARKNQQLREAFFAHVHDTLYLPEPMRPEQSLTLWLGVCGEKRAWIEQEEGLFALLDGLARLPYRVRILCDSMTCTASADAAAYRATFTHELALLERLRAHAGTRLQIDDVIGAPLLDKIRAAREVDVFFTHALTDSMVVAAIARKPGVAYTVEGNTGTVHFHPATRMIPEDAVRPVHVYAHAWKMGDYHMDPQRVIPDIMRAVTDVLAAKMRGLSGDALLTSYRNAPSTSTTQETAMPSHPSADSMRNLERWERPVHHYPSVETFLATPSLADGIHAIAYHDAYIELNLYPRQTEALLIFFNAALSTRNETTTLPAFSGKTALTETDASVLMVSDATLYRDPHMKLAWYAGAQGFPLQHDLARVLQHVQKALGVTRPILCGGSGGGFAALYYAPFLDHAIAVPCNPQTNILTYAPDITSHYLAQCYGYHGSPEGFAEAPIPEKPTYLLRAPHAGSTRILYLQNARDDRHYARDFLSYLSSYGIMRGEALVEQHSPTLISVRGEGWGDGHAAPPTDFLFPLLRLLCHPDGWERAPHEIPTLYKKTRKLFEKTTIWMEDGKFYGKACFADRTFQGKIILKLYRDKQVIETQVTKHDTPVIFHVPADGGLYQITAIFRKKPTKTQALGGDAETTHYMKSKRITLRAR